MDELRPDDDFMEDVRELFERAAEYENENRLRGLDDIRFARMSSQWPENVRRQRELDGRPCHTINRLPTFIRQVVNDARQNRPAIEVRPSDSGADPATAEVLSGLIRNIEAISDADIAYDTAIESAVSGGFGYFRINTSYTSDDTFDQDIIIERIADPFTVYGDPESTAADGSDWNCCFIVKMMQKDDFEKQYKGKDAVDWDALGYSGLPAPWMDGDQVMVAEYWKREEVEREIVMLSNDTTIALDEYEDTGLADMGVVPVGQPRRVKSHKVTQYVMSGAEVLETVEWPGKYIPIVPVYGDEVWCEGKRNLYSLISNAKDAQRELNYWRTTTTELIALAPKAPFIGPKGAFDSDIDKWSTANHYSHPFIEYDGPEAPARQPFAGPPAGAIQQALQAQDDMKAIIGIYDASLGARSNETSGRAIEIRQREGDVSTFHFIDNLSRSIRYAGRILLDLIPKVYSTARIVRVLGEDMAPENVAIAPPEQQQEMMAQIQAKGQAIARIFDITAGKYDLTVKAGPSFTTQREQTRAELVEIIRAYPDAATILGPMYLRNSDWPGADKAADLLEQSAGQEQAPQQPQIPPEVIQQVQQMQQELQRLTQENEALKANNAFEQAKMLNVEMPKAQAAQTKAQADVIRANADMAKVQMAATDPFGMGQLPTTL